MNRREFSWQSTLGIVAGVGVLSLDAQKAVAADMNTGSERSMSFTAAKSSLSKYELPNAPDLDPNNGWNQFIYGADFVARFAGLAALGLGITGAVQLAIAIGKGDFATALPILEKAAENDPDLKRIYNVIKSYTGKDAQPLGYYACVVIHNTNAGVGNWVPDPLPWGQPGP